MKKVVLVGCNGRMGQTVVKLLKNDSEMEIVCGVDVVSMPCDFPVYSSLSELNYAVDVLIDFSNANSIDDILSYCSKFSVPPVLCSTGYSESQIAKIDCAAKKLPVFRSGNMSLGINLLTDLIQRIVHVLGEEYDIEIIEKHHNKKIDAPSGTALMLADAAKKARGAGMNYVYDRTSKRQQRDINEIGISSVRGGTIVGEHEVIFAGHDEVITLKHSIGSRDVFASGAIKAARYMANIQKPGIYSMSDIISE